MADTSTDAEQTGLGTKARFELDSLEVHDDRLLVCGTWHEVRGLRFVRPTLLVDGAQVLASLDHKPWDAEGSPWIAAFPWTDDAPHPDRLRLSVAPRVTVRLSEREDEAGTGRFARQAPREDATAETGP